MESVQLGRFVTNAMEPHQDFFDLPVGPQSDEILIKSQDNFKKIINLSRNSNIRSHLTALLSITHERNSTGTSSLTAERTTTYQLLNSGNWFLKACAQPDTRTWFEKCLQYTEDVYLVVGVHTLTNPFSTKKLIFGGTTGGGAHLSDLTGGTVPGFVGGARINSVREVRNNHEHAFSGTGEQIYAIQYRKLKFSWFSSPTIEKSFLEPCNRWKVFWEPGNRGEESDEEEEDDVVEVEFTDEFDFGLDEVHFSEDGDEELMV